MATINELIILPCLGSAQKEEQDLEVKKTDMYVQVKNNMYSLYPVCHKFWFWNVIIKVPKTFQSCSYVFMSRNSGEIQRFFRVLKYQRFANVVIAFSWISTS